MGLLSPVLQNILNLPQINLISDLFDDLGVPILLLLFAGPLAAMLTELTCWQQLQLAAVSDYSGDMLPPICFEWLHPWYTVQYS